MSNSKFRSYFNKYPDKAPSPRSWSNKSFKVFRIVDENGRQTGEIATNEHMEQFREYWHRPENIFNMLKNPKPKAKDFYEWWNKYKNEIT